MKLFYDTETSGLADFKMRSADPSQPHIVQLALLLTEDDGTEFCAQSVLIKPNGWTISPEMTAIHGVSHERAMDEGLPEELAADMFVSAQAKADLRVAHNESFDRRILRIAMVRAGITRDFIEAIEARASYCTATRSSPIVNLPPTAAMLAKGMRTPKTPKLVEAYRHFFGEEMIGAHEAMADARACARVFFHLQTLRAPAA